MRFRIPKDERNGVKVIKTVLPMPADAVKNIAFQLKGQFTENLFVVIGSVFENKQIGRASCRERV